MINGTQFVDCCTETEKPDASFPRVVRGHEMCLMSANLENLSFNHPEPVGTVLVRQQQSLVTGGNTSKFQHSQLLGKCHA